MSFPVNDSSSSNEMPLNARAVVVNRTHRVVREQAMQMRQKRERSRGLWVPFLIFSILLPVICYAVWSMMDGYDAISSGIPAASGQIFVLLLWSLPVTALAIAMVWVKRNRRDGEI